MKLWLWSLYFLPVSGALKFLPEVNLDGTLGGSVLIECPLAGQKGVRMYLCRQMPNSGICNTVVSNNFVKKEYKDRITLIPSPDKTQFLVEMSELTESDSGVYACGLGSHTNRDRTQKVILTVHNDSGALKFLPEVNLDGPLGGSVLIECPLAGETGVQMYLCREMPNSGMCSTVVSNNFVRKEYKDRITLMPSPDKTQFLVEMSELTESDSGVYACGLGFHTNRDRTQKVILTVHNEYELFLEEEPHPWFSKLPQQQMPYWPQMVPQTRDAEFIPEVAVPAQRTEVAPVHHSCTTTPTTHQPRSSRASSAAATKLPTLLPPTEASESAAHEGVLGPQEGSYKHHTWLYRQRAFNAGSQAGWEDQGFHILIPSVLGFLLLALLGLLLRRAIQRRRAFSRRIRRLAIRMRGVEASGRPGSRQARAGQRPRSQNVYSACPRRAPRAASGPDEAPPPERGSAGPSALSQMPETPWLHAPSHKTSCEYVTISHQPAAQREDPDSAEDDYINIPSLASLPRCPPGPTPWLQ